MVDYGSFNICLDDEVNEAFVTFSYDQNFKISAEQLVSMLIGYGLVQLGYMDLYDLPWEEKEN